MNAKMRRIDLFCKLMGPLTISLVTIASIEIAIWTTLFMNVASVLIEYLFIHQVSDHSIPAYSTSFPIFLHANLQYRSTREYAA